MIKFFAKKFSIHRQFNLSVRGRFLTPQTHRFFAIFVFLLASFYSVCSANSNSNTAIFAGGCFWCMEYPFDRLEGVLSTKSGYTGGVSPNPSYEIVSGGMSGHVEVVQVIFDPTKISYEQLLEVYWKNIDPFQGNGQFCDVGLQYKAIIFVNSSVQKLIAEESRQNLEKSYFGKEAIVVEIRPVSVFFEAETYHQDYYQKNPIRYKLYRYRCGRDQRLRELWGSQ